MSVFIATQAEQQAIRELEVVAWVACQAVCVGRGGQRPAVEDLTLAEREHLRLALAPWPAEVRRLWRWWVSDGRPKMAEPLTTAAA